MSGSWSAQNTWAKVVEIAAVLGVILAVVFSLKSCSQTDEANQRDSLNLVFGGGVSKRFTGVRVGA